MGVGTGGWEGVGWVGDARAVGVRGAGHDEGGLERRHHQRATTDTRRIACVRSFVRACALHDF